MMNIMKFIDALYYCALATITAFCALIIIFPDWFSLNVILGTLIFMMITFLIINYYFKRKYPRKQGTNIIGFTVLGVSAVYLIYVLSK